MVQDLVDCIVMELEQRKAELECTDIRTIYFGGGTPSILNESQLNQILGIIHREYTVSTDVELTMEANPDDVSIQLLQSWKKLGINRVSLGIQSLHDDDLAFMNRSHLSVDALRSLDELLEVGNLQISVDLIFGYQGLCEEKLLHNLHYLAAKPLHHMSCYSLTVEPKTVFNHRRDKGELIELCDAEVNLQYQLIHTVLESFGFEHYEVSNYCRNQQYAKHNTNYWKGEEYLGVGPSAHSFFGNSRAWNVSNNQKYMHGIRGNKSEVQRETLSSKNKYNEYILTGLRTKWGIQFERLHSLDRSAIGHFEKETAPYLESGKIQKDKDTYRIHQDFWSISDSIISDLFLV